MKNKRPLFVVLLCLLLAGGVVLALIPCSPMPWQCSKLYWQYRGQEGIKATYVKQYPVDDTTLVDVTLLQATTDSAWTLLSQDFGVKPLNNKIIERHGKNAVSMRLAPKKDYSLPMDTTCRTNNDLLLISRAEQIICIFHVSSSWQIKEIEDWQFNAMINRTPLKTIENEQ
jgi:hypothetical protein